MPAQEEKKNILFIGGGTATSGAYLMAQRPDKFNVMLVEKEPELGGHIQSKKVTRAEIIAKGYKRRDGKPFRMGRDSVGNEVQSLELGAEFVGSYDSYNLMHLHFAHLGIKLNKFKMSAHLHPIPGPHGESNGVSDNDIVLPPAYVTTGDGNCFSSCFASLCGADGDRQNEVRVDWDTLRDGNDLAILVYFKLAMDDYIERINKNPGECRYTLDEFINKFIAEHWYLPNIDNLGRQFTSPMTQGQWGISQDHAKRYMAQFALNYLSLGMDWYDSPDGLQSYIRETERRMANKVDIRKNTAVDYVEQIEGTTPPKYKVRLLSGEYLQQGNADAVFDDVVVSTHANVTAKIIRNLPGHEEKSRILAKAETFKTYLAFHVDQRFETDKETVVHTRMEAGMVRNTAQKDWKGPVMKTWMRAAPGMDPLDPDPAKVLHYQEWTHDHMMESYEAAQTAAKLSNAKLRAHPESGGVRITGSMEGGKTGGGDSHNDGLRSNMQAALDMYVKHGVDVGASPVWQIYVDRTEHGYELKNSNSQLPSQLSAAQMSAEHSKSLSERIAHCDVYRAELAASRAHLDDIKDHVQELQLGRGKAIAQRDRELQARATPKASLSFVAPMSQSAATAAASSSADTHVAPGNIPHPQDAMRVAATRAAVAEKMKAINTQHRRMMTQRSEVVGARRCAVARVR